MVGSLSPPTPRRDLFVLLHEMLAVSLLALQIWSSMSCDSSSKSPKAPRAFKVDKSDELDANIRNFAPVARIMKNALPENAKIAKEAKECMQECVSEFISFITSEGKL